MLPLAGTPALAVCIQPLQGRHLPPVCLRHLFILNPDTHNDCCPEQAFIGGCDATKALQSEGKLQLRLMSLGLFATPRQVAAKKPAAAHASPTGKPLHSAVIGSAEVV